MSLREKTHRVGFINFIKHIHPVKIPLHCVSFKNTLGLGGLSLILVLLLMITGSLLLLIYKPSPTLAYASILTLENDYIFGKLIRSVHFFSANLLVILSSCHMLRVFFTLGYTGVRRSNWVIGIFIFLLIMFSCFTGYLLPWDQTAFWAVTICINTLEYLPLGTALSSLTAGSQGVTARTLHIFFTCHTTLIPLFLLFLTGIHFWKIRKAGGVVFSDIPVNGDKKMIRTYPHLFLREAAAGMILLALIMTLALMFKAPLGDIANEGLSPNPAKAPWYFAGLQELLLYFHPYISVFLIPCSGLIIILSLPFMTEKSCVSGIWFISQRAARAGALSAFFSSISTILLVFLNESDLSFPWLSSGTARTGIPLFFIMAIIITANHFFLKKRFNLSRNETIQSTFIFLITGYVLLTIIGVWFRGKGMSLIW